MQAKHPRGVQTWSLTRPALPALLPVLRARGTSEAGLVGAGKWRGSRCRLFFFCKSLRPQRHLQSYKEGQRGQCEVMPCTWRSWPRDEHRGGLAGCQSLLGFPVWAMEAGCEDWGCVAREWPCQGLGMFRDAPKTARWQRARSSALHFPGCCRHIRRLGNLPSVSICKRGPPAYCHLCAQSCLTL